MYQSLVWSVLFYTRHCYTHKSIWSMFHILHRIHTNMTIWQHVIYHTVCRPCTYSTCVFVLKIGGVPLRFPQPGISVKQGEARNWWNCPQKKLALSKVVCQLKLSELVKILAKKWKQRICWLFQCLSLNLFFGGLVKFIGLEVELEELVLPSKKSPGLLSHWRSRGQHGNSIFRHFDHHHR